MNQSTNSFIHTFKGYGGCKSQCQVDIIHENGQTIVVFTDLGIGTSVTNASEIIATEVVRKLNLDPIKTLFAERYRPGEKDEVVDQIQYTWDGTKFRSPQWLMTHCIDPQLRAAIRQLATSSSSNGSATMPQ